MNRRLTWMLPVFAAMLLAGAVRAEQKEDPAPLPPPPGTEEPGKPGKEPPQFGKLFNSLTMSVKAHAGMEVKKIKGSFLGITTKAADETLRKQLQLADGIGLVVTFVDTESPAKAAGLEVHDVLHKFDDQILINERQLLTLVRMHKPGEKIELTLIRGGKEQKVPVTLVEKDVLPLNAFDETGMAPMQDGNGLRTFHWRVPPPLPGYFLNRSGGGGVWTQGMSLSDPKFNIKLENQGNDVTMLVKDKDGNVIYKGPANAGAKVPEDVLTHLDDAMKVIKLERVINDDGDVLEWREDDGMEGGEAGTAVPAMPVTKPLPAAKQ